jgi:hypothetical protein
MQLADAPDKQDSRGPLAIRQKENPSGQVCLKSVRWLAGDIEYCMTIGNLPAVALYSSIER